MKLSAAFEASIALSFGDVSDAYQFFPSTLGISDNPDYRANLQHCRITDINYKRNHAGVSDHVRLNADAVAALPVSVHAIAGYGGPGCAMPLAGFLKGVIVRGASWRKAPAGPRRACCCPPIPRCPPPSRHTPGGGASSPCSEILKWSMAWGPCGSAAAPPCCAGFTSSRSPAPLLTPRGPSRKPSP